MADSSTTVQKVSAEALGTFVLVFIGCGTAIFSGGDYVAIGLAFGLTVLAGAYAFGRISGSHFNPAISVGGTIVIVSMAHAATFLIDRRKAQDANAIDPPAEP